MNIWQVVDTMLFAYPPPLAYDYQQLTVSAILEIKVEPIYDLVSRLLEESDLSDFAKDTAYSVASCESGVQQYDGNGSVLRGRENAQDVGVFQINERYHREEADRLGFNIYEPDGNVRYAIYLIEHYGFVPWIWSRDCWTR